MKSLVLYTQRPDNKTDEGKLFDEYFRQYNCVVHISYNFILDDCELLIKDDRERLKEMNNKRFELFKDKYDKTKNYSKEELKTIDKQLKDIDQDIKNLIEQIDNAGYNSFQYYINMSKQFIENVNDSDKIELLNKNRKSESVITVDDILSSLKYRLFVKTNNIDLFKDNTVFMHYAISDAHDRVMTDIRKISMTQDDIKNLYKRIDKLQNKLSKKNLKDENQKKIESDIIHKISLIEHKINDLKIRRVFGTKEDMLSTCSYHIDDEIRIEHKNDFVHNRKFSSIYIKGDKDYKGSRFMKILKNEDTDEYSFIFCPNSKTNIELYIQDFHGYKDIIDALYYLQENKTASISYRLCENKISVSIDDEIMYKKQNKNKGKKNRIISVDLNPDNIGYTITDWYSSSRYKIIYKGVINFKKINECKLPRC